jgi:hypothetical protein
MLADDTQGYWLKDTHWVDHPDILSYVNTISCMYCLFFIFIYLYVSLIRGKVKLSRYRPEQAHGRSGRLRPRIFLTFGRSSALRTGRLYSQEFSWYSFLEAESIPGHMVPSVASEKIPSDTTGDRSQDLPTSSAVLIRGRKGKVAPVHSMMAYKGSRVIVPVLMSALGGGELLTSHPGGFIPRKELME